MSQFLEIAHLIKSISGQLFELTGPAGTDLEFAKIRVANWKVLPEIAYTPADLAIGITRIGSGMGINLR
jgi:hypothetical protein